MSEVKRYGYLGIVEEEDGEVVKWEDYAALKAERDALAAESAARGEIIERLIGQFSAAGYHAIQNSLNPAQSLLYDAMQVLKQPATEAYLNSVRADVIPEGYVIVPQQMHLSADAMESLCFHCGDGGFAFGDFTDGLLWVGDIENDDGTKTYGLNITTAEYPEEGSANISEFAAQLRAGKDGE
ncbi:hypothetical protein WKG92_07310 [Pantoea agglomerans]|uniref:hypothetical protein n=1 Tax=Enterobacter agglomerans TaxID=549 RepID=UPI003C7CA062